MLRDALGFRWNDYDGTPATSPTARLTRRGGILCGVYILEFDDGEQYVGQSTDFAARFAAHRRNQRGTIVAYGFLRAPQRDLGELERNTTWMLAAQGRRLRGSALLGQPLPSLTLNAVLDEDVQEAWRSGEDTAVVLGERVNRLDPTPSAVTNYERLRAHPAFAVIVDGFADHIAMAIPHPHLTERRFWTVSAMPSTNRTSENQRLAALSINVAEVLVVNECRYDGEPFSEWLTHLPVAAGLPAPVEAGLERYCVEVHSDFHSCGPLATYYSATPLPRSPALLQAARSHAIGLLRKGQTINHRSHNTLLADDLFAAIEARHLKA